MSVKANTERAGSKGMDADTALACLCLLFQGPHGATTESSAGTWAGKNFTCQLFVHCGLQQSGGGGGTPEEVL